MQKNNIIWIVIGVIVIAAVLFAVTRNSTNNTITGSQEQNAQTMNTAQNTNTPSSEEPQTLNGCTRDYDPNKFASTKVEFQNKVATLQVRGYGSVVIALNDKAAPKTVENFVKLAESGFYNCLTFHRIAKDFVIQGGDPAGTGAGGPGYTIPAEIGLKHTKGSIAMARTGDEVNPKRDSSGSQFYIALNDLPMLDGAYTVFGQVTQGVDVVAKIGNVQILGGADGPPKDPVVIEKVTVTNK